jgi:5'-nucleotidase
MKKPFILLVNDDGIEAPGLKHLWRGLQNMAELVIVAPTEERSGAGVGITPRRPLYIQPVAWENDTPAWRVNGTPADCVKLGLCAALDRKPDLIVSGINNGQNAGRNAFYSGTVGAVIEGVMRGIPGLAMSITYQPKGDFSLAERHVGDLVHYLLEHPLPPGTLLNANFPSAGEVEKLAGIRFTRQGLGYWSEQLCERLHPDGYPYYWLGGVHREFDEPEESDIALLKQGYATVTPLFVENLTHHEEFQRRKEQFNARFSS